MSTPLPGKPCIGNSISILRGSSLLVLLLAAVLVPCQGVLGQEICNNGIDDNGDGFIDCADPDCADYFSFTESPQQFGNSWSFGVAIGDLDNDGDLDVWVANGLNNITDNFEPNRVYLNQGHGQNGVEGEFLDNGQELGNSDSRQVALGDFNNDGFLDAWVVNGSNQPNRVWINDGEGNFTDSGQELGNSWSVDVALADLNDDGFLDAWVQNGGSNQPNLIWLNNGSGEFFDSGQEVGNVNNYGVALGDLDSDEDVDAFVANREEPNHIWFNQGGSQQGTEGDFLIDSSQSLGNFWSYDVALGDLDNDGDLDAWVVNHNLQPNRVWINQGGNQQDTEGVFLDSFQELGESESHSVALMDLNGDGFLDAWVANGVGVGNFSNRVYLNDQSGNFSASPQELGDSWSTDVALGDLDGDGDVDAWVTNRGQSNRVWFNDACSAAPPVEDCTNGIDDDADQLIDCEDPECAGLVTFTDSGQELGVNQSDAVALGDLDGDGDLDAWVAVGIFVNQANRVWINQGGIQGGVTGSFADSGQGLGNSLSSGIALGDLDGDGDLDAWVTNRGQSNRVWINDGDANFTDTLQQLGNSWSAVVALGDLDGDGDLDAWVTNYNSQPNRVWINDGCLQDGTAGSFTDSLQEIGNSSSIHVALGDLDGDGDLDAWVANTANQPNRVWLNDGGLQNGTPGNFTDSGQLLGNSNSSGVALGDLDGDGDLDAWVANTANQPNRVWLNDGGFQNGTPGNFTDSLQQLGNSESYDVTLGDLDGDGDIDAWVANANIQNLGQPNRVWLNDGSGDFFDSGQELGNSLSLGIALGDLDGDDALDAWVANSDQPNRVWLYEGCFTPPQFTAPEIISFDCSQTDPNGDVTVCWEIAENCEPLGSWPGASILLGDSTEITITNPTGCTTFAGLPSGPHCFSLQVDDCDGNTVTTSSCTLTVGTATPEFVRGDTNASGEPPDIADVINSLFYAFDIPGGISPCDDASDVNDDGLHPDIADVIYLLGYLFPGKSGSLPPPAPFPACGPDPTPDGLDCASFPPCP